MSSCLIKSGCHFHVKRQTENSTEPFYQRINNLYFQMALARVKWGCIHIISDAATKMQHFPFIFNGTPCGGAATAVGASSDSLHHNSSPSSPFGCGSPRLTAGVNHMSLRFDNNIPQQTIRLNVTQCHFWVIMYYDLHSVQLPHNLAWFHCSHRFGVNSALKAEHRSSLWGSEQHLVSSTTERRP